MIALATCLPDDASQWPFELCSIFFAALSSTLSTQMTDNDKFVMPAVYNLRTKASQLVALREVRSAAASSYRTLSSQKSQMLELMRLMVPAKSSSQN